MFTSPTHGKVTFDKAFEHIKDYMSEDPKAKYKLIVGTDSQVLSREIKFTTALIVRKVGNGAIYFYKNNYEPKGMSLQSRILNEASLSLDYASRLAKKLADGNLDYDIEIHLDVGDGEQNKTKSIVRQVTGMITGSGFTAYIKPNAYGASTVADKYTKR